MTDAMVAGVCGGIARKFNIDSTIVRLVTLGVAVFTGIFPVAFLYGAAWIIMEGESDW